MDLLKEIYKPRGAAQARSGGKGDVHPWTVAPHGSEAWESEKSIHFMVIIQVFRKYEIGESR